MRRVALIAAGLCAACGGDGDRSTLRDLHPPVVPPQQQSARLAAVHMRFGNPPQFELVTMDADGSKPRVVLRAPGNGIQRISSPSWSADGKRIYFVGTIREREGDDFIYEEADVFVVDADGGSPERVTDSKDVVEVAPAPDGRTLLVSRYDHPAERPLYASSLWLLDLNGENATKLVAEKAEDALDMDGAWSADATTIVFSRCRLLVKLVVEGRCDLHTVGRDGRRLRRVAERASDGAFSPDGGSIAFVTDRDETGRYRTGSDEDAFAAELYVMDTDGGGARRLTDTRSLSENSPTWSPDGSQIAFGRTGPSDFVDQVMVVDADGGCAVRIAGNAADPTEGATSWEAPAWRPGRIAAGLDPLPCPQAG